MEASNLAQKKCVPCEGGVPPITGDELETYLQQVHGDWKLSDDDKKIHREFKFKNFAEALAFVNKVGEIAEAEDHHPDVYLAWGRVTVWLFTHAIGGLSENDFILAAKIDTIDL
jgi:4a-hydroxytetrahydrobiopterin dehydratase